MLPPSLGHLAEVGYRGVELFFVISGFVLAATVTAKGNHDRQGLKAFALRRLFRIFPACLTVFVPLALIGLLTGLGAPETGTIAGNLLRNLLLLPRNDVTTYMPVVAWTLTHELMFYANFALVFVNRSLALGTLLAWAATAVILDVTDLVPDGWRMQFSLLNLYFLVGMGAPQLGRRIAAPATIPLCCAVGAIAGAIALDSPSVRIDIGARTLLYTVGFGLLVLAASKLSVPAGKAWQAPVQWMGEQSYSFYLIHYAVIVAMAMLVSASGAGAGTLLTLSFVLSFGISRIPFHLIERLGIRLGRKLGVGSAK